MKTLLPKYKTVSKWIPVTSIPASPGLRMEFMEEHKIGKHGCYQFAHKNDLKKLNGIVDCNTQKILYTGKSKNMVVRTYGVRSKNGKHNARAFLWQTYDVNDLYVRYITTVNVKQTTDLEKAIHKANVDKFGKRYAHNGVSGGPKGDVTKTIDLISRIENLDELKTIALAIKERSGQLTTGIWFN